MLTTNILTRYSGIITFYERLSMYDAAFFDFDGTLQSFTTQSVPESALQALTLLRNKGLKVILATGRHKTELKQSNSLFTFDAYITLNGQYCYDSDGVFRKLCIGKDDVKIAVEQATKKIYPCFFVEENKKYCNYVDEKVSELHRIVKSPEPDVRDPAQALDADIFQLCAYLPKEKEHLLLDHLREVEALRWYPSFTDIVPKGGCKKAGIEAVMSRYGLSPTRIMTFGDGENDIDMLEYAQTGVAMGNAQPHVKAAADYVTDDVDSDGILNAVRHFFGE